MLGSKEISTSLSLLRLAEGKHAAIADRNLVPENHWLMGWKGSRRSTMETKLLLVKELQEVREPIQQAALNCTISGCHQVELSVVGGHLRADDRLLRTKNQGLIVT